VEPRWDAGLRGFDVPRVDVAHRSVVGTGEGVSVVRALRRAVDTAGFAGVIGCGGFAVSWIDRAFGVVGNDGARGDSNSNGCCLRGGLQGQPRESF
jgi:hypothetical protein